MFLGSNIPRSKTTHSIYAPTPMKYETDDTAPVKTTYRRIGEPVEWKPSEYSRQLFNQTFRKWDVEE